jgi:hypothetical protein
MQNQAISRKLCLPYLQNFSFGYILERPSGPHLALILSIQLIKLVYRYYGIIQTGYRQLLKDLHDEESLGLDSPELDSMALPDLVSGQQSQALSRVASMRLAPDGNDTAVDGFGQNNFTTVAPSYKGDEHR